MTPPLNPVLFSYLTNIQRSKIIGRYRHERATPVSGRSIYRWHRNLGDRLLVIPVVQVEHLGLRHAHVFLKAPVEDAVSCPYAVEAAIVTADFSTETMYLHCLVPQGHERALSRWAETVGTDVRVTWTGTPWQQFLTPAVPVTLPLPVTPKIETGLLRRAPMIVPAVMEAWTYPNTLPHAWHRITRRAGNHLPSYMRNATVSRTGWRHVGAAFEELQQAQLVNQHLVRCHPLLAMSVEVFTEWRLPREVLCNVLEKLRTFLHAVEAYPTGTGHWVRLLGPHRLLDAIANLSATARSACTGFFFHTKRHPAPRVRFAYEQLFNPKTGTWMVDV